MAAPSRSGPGISRSLAALVALGLALRLYHYGRNPALWHDEAANVINVLNKNFLELLGPLYGSATGPPIFLWLQKCVMLALDDSLFSLRLLSLLASCAGLLIFAWIARRTLPSLAASVAVLLVACSDRLLWHAAEARHYSSDFLIATLLVALLGLTNQWPTPKRAALFAALAPAIIFASYPGVFLLGGVFLALWPSLRNGKHWTAAAFLSASIALSFAAFYFITIRAQRSTAMDAAWIALFPNWQRPWTVPFWAIRSTIGIFDYIGRPIGGILLVPAAIGAIRFWREERRELVWFAIAPLLLAMLAAFVRAYPYTGARTMVFAMPALILLIGYGLDGLVAWRAEGPPVRRFALALGLIPIAVTLGFALYRVAIPWPRADTAIASDYVLTHRQANEPVTANHYEYEYYFRHLGGAFTPEMRLLAERPQPARLWIVMTAGDPRTREDYIKNLSGWQVLERHEFVRTSVLLATPR